jgi:hypothetical protein
VGVGLGVGRGVAPGVGVGGVTLAPGELGGRVAGAGVGPPATIGPSVDVADGSGATDALEDSLGDALEPGSVVGVAFDVAAGVPDGDPEGVTTGWLGAGVPEAWATPLGGLVGATTPAVSATVARMRFRTPMATTRRAR